VIKRRDKREILKEGWEKGEKNKERRKNEVQKERERDCKVEGDKGKKEGEGIERWRIFERGRKKKECLREGERKKNV